jgi:hypothetical protein
MFYARCSYDGQKTKDSKRMHGRGIFTFANGNRYVGTFHDGAFHGQGIIFFTKENGGGQYRGVWDQGKNLSGQYFFSDGLPFEEKDWGHCVDADRRLWEEYLVFIQPCGVETTAEGVAAAKAGTSYAANTITPDYARSDGIPAAFANGKPRGLHDINDGFWRSAAPPQPEYEYAADPLQEPEMAEVIAAACPRSH